MASKQLSTRDGRFVVTQARWDSNGAHHVIVADNVLATVLSDPAYVNDTAKRRARDLARRVDPMGRDHVKWTRLDAIETHVRDNGEYQTNYLFTVSRLDPMYR